MKVTVRNAVVGAILAFLTFWVPAFAHEGHKTGQIVADAQVVSVGQQTVALNIALYNAGMSDATLQGASVQGARVETLHHIVVPAGTIEEGRIELRFDSKVPGIFTVILDFGDAGQGPVVVMP